MKSIAYELVIPIPKTGEKRKEKGSGKGKGKGKRIEKKNKSHDGNGVLSIKPFNQRNLSPDAII